MARSVSYASGRFAGTLSGTMPIPFQGQRNVAVWKRLSIVGKYRMSGSAPQPQQSIILLFHNYINLLYS